MNDITNIKNLVLSGSGGGKGSSGSSGGKEAANTLRSNAVVRVIDVLSEGSIEGFVTPAIPGQSIYFNGTPLQDSAGKFNFEGVSYQVRYGTPDQSFVPGYPAVETVDNVGTVVSILNGPVTYSVTNAAVTSFLVTISLASLYVVDSSNGNMNPYHVELAIDTQVNGSANWTQVVLDTITGKCVSPYERSYKITVPSGSAFPITLRMRRISADDANSTQQSVITWTEVTEQIEHQLIYPNTAYIALTVDATAFGGSIPVRTYDINGIEIRIPANYDPIGRTYAATGIGTTAGTWDGVTFKVAWSNNPAWVLFDLLTNSRYGLGDVITESYCDVFTLYTIGQYCDGLVDNGSGGLEQRYTFNGVINSSADAYSVVQSIASVFMGMTYWGAGQITVVQDAPAGISKLFTESNVIDGAFEYQGTALNSRHSMCAVQYLDPTNSYRATVELVADAAAIQLLGIRRKDVTGLGITSRGQAIRFARWVLDSESHSTETVQFSVGIRDGDVRPGEVVAIQDAHYAGVRNGGRTLQPPAASGIPRTNWITNGNAVGAVGPTNTMPTGWYINSDSVIIKVMGSGNDSGVGYVDLQVTGQGVALDTDIFFGPGIVTNPGQQITGSAFIKLMAGDYTNVSGVAVGVSDSVTKANYEGVDLRVASEAGYVRGTSTMTATDVTHPIDTYLRLLTVPGGTLNFVIRVGGAQWEGGTIATRYIPTFGTIGIVYEANPTVIYLDGPVTILAGYAYSLLVTDPTGIVQLGNVINIAGTYEALTMAAPLAASPPPGSVWILQSTQLEPRPFRVLSVSETAQNIYEIVALLYDGAKYGRVDAGLPYVDTNYSDLLPATQSPIPPPLEVVAIEYVTGVGSTSVDTVTVSWSVRNDGRVVGYELQVLAADGATILRDQITADISVDITGLTPATYYFRVRGQTTSGAFSAWTTSAAFIDTGYSSVPGATSSMIATGTFNSVSLTWVNPVDRLLSYIKVYRSTDTVFAHASVVANISSTNYNDANLNNQLTYSYWTQAVDTTGQVSPLTGPATAKPLQIGSADLAAGILTIDAFAASVSPVFVWTGDALPYGPGAVQGATLILWTSNYTLYTWNPATGKWESAAVQAISASNITAGTLNAGIILSSLASFGTLKVTNAQIANLTITTGLIEDGQIGQPASVAGKSNPMSVSINVDNPSSLVFVTGTVYLVINTGSDGAYEFLLTVSNNNGVLFQQSPTAGSASSDFSYLIPFSIIDQGQSGTVTYTVSVSVINEFGDVNDWVLEQIYILVVGIMK